MDGNAWIPFDEWVKLEVERIVKEVTTWANGEGIRSDHPLLLRAISDLRRKVESVMRADLAVQTAAFNAATQ